MTPENQQRIAAPHDGGESLRQTGAWSEQALHELAEGAHTRQDDPPTTLQVGRFTHHSNVRTQGEQGMFDRVQVAGAAVHQETHRHDLHPMVLHRQEHRGIAFASDRYGNFDVFVMPAEGGEARRVTFHSAQEYPYTFTNDDKSIIFGAARMDAAGNRAFQSCASSTPPIRRR